MVANLAAEGAVLYLSINICKYSQIFTTDELSVVEIPISATLALCLETGSKFMQLMLLKSSLVSKNYGITIHYFVFTSPQ